MAGSYVISANKYTPLRKMIIMIADYVSVT